MKKLFFIALFFCLLLPVSANAAALLGNGDFETVHSSGEYVTVWYGPARESFTDEKAYYGTKSIKLEGGSYTFQNISTTLSGEYVLEFAYYGSTPKVDFRKNNKEIILTPSSFNITPAQNGWKIYSTVVSFPENSTGISLYFLNTNETQYYDWVSLEKPIQPLLDYNLITNAAFDSSLTGWNGETAANMVYTQNGGYVGGAMKISSDDIKSWDSFATYNVSGLTPGATYRTGALLKTENFEGSFQIKLEYRNFKNGIYNKITSDMSTEAWSGDITGLNGKWVQGQFEFTLPPEANALLFRPRITGGKGDAYIDNTFLIKVKDASRATLETDKCFYYAEDESCKVTASLNTLFASSYEKMQFSIADGNIEKYKSDWLPFATEATLPISTLEIDGRAYTVKIYFKNGTEEYYGGQTDFYKYPKPSVINEARGHVMAYYVPELYFDEAAAAGITLVQAYKPTSTWGNLLDQAEKHGLRVLIPLYGGQNFAADPERIQATVEIVNEIKNKPALLGYMIADEPLYAFNTADAEERLKNAYRLIKTMDTEHAVFINESAVVEKNFSRTSRYADIFSIDPYAGRVGETNVNYVKDKVKIAKAAVPDKPLYVVLQTFSEEGYNWQSADAVRAQVYQALGEGADAIGWYCFKDAKKEEGVDLNKTDVWHTLRSLGNLEIPAYFYLAESANGENIAASYKEINGIKTLTSVVKLNKKEDLSELVISNEEKCSISLFGLEALLKPICESKEWSMKPYAAN